MRHFSLNTSFNNLLYFFFISSYFGFNPVECRLNYPNLKKIELETAFFDPQVETESAFAFYFCTEGEADMLETTGKIKCSSLMGEKNDTLVLFLISCFN